MDIARLHFITQTLPDRTHSEQAALACAGGVRWVQLRVKNTLTPEWREIALDTQEICASFGATFVVNDNVHLAREINAHGVHLGKEDMPPQEARTIAGEKFIIGGTANTFEDIQLLAEAGVDYIGLGPFRFTTTKENISPVLGIEGYTTILQQCRDAGIHIPIIAIGGIVHSDVRRLMETGIHGIAVSSAIGKAADPAEAASLLLHELDV